MRRFRRQCFLVARNCEKQSGFLERYRVLLLKAELRRPPNFFLFFCSRHTLQHKAFFVSLLRFLLRDSFSKVILRALRFTVSHLFPPFFSCLCTACGMRVTRSVLLATASRPRLQCPFRIEEHAIACTNLQLFSHPTSACGGIYIAELQLVVSPSWSQSNLRADCRFGREATS